MKYFIVLSLLYVYSVSSTVFFNEEFDSKWRDRWVESTHKGAEAGKFGWTAGKFYSDAEKDKGLQTSQDAKFYDISSKFPKVSNKDKNLVIQFQIKHEQNIDCGGGYLKIFGDDVDQTTFHGESPYSIMFGPDICGMTKKVHVIFNYNGQNHLIKKEIACKEDELSHLYTLILRPDNTYEVQIDLEKVESGSIEDDWDMLKPKKIKDPKESKPSDWVDEEEIDDPSDSKPADWDKPKTISDPKAKKPDDWDVEMDGEWEAAQIDNPDYKGEWKPKQIKNPKYKGPWVHPEIDNPEYKADDSLYAFDNLAAVGVDLWQVKSGTIFDNILITDDIDYAKKYGTDTWKAMSTVEKSMKEKSDAEEQKKSDAEAELQKKKDEAAKKDTADSTTDKKKDDDDDDSDDDDDDSSSDAKSEKKEKDEL